MTNNKNGINDTMFLILGGCSVAMVDEHRQPKND